MRSRTDMNGNYGLTGAVVLLRAAVMRSEGSDVETARLVTTGVTEVWLV